MGEVQLDTQLFRKRMEKILDAMEDLQGEVSQGADKKKGDCILMIAIGKRDDIFSYGINSAMFLYLLGYEFPETIILLKRGTLITIASTKKSAILEQLKEVVEVKSFIRAKDNSNQDYITKAVEEIVGEKGRGIGILEEERGPFVSMWQKEWRTYNATAAVEKVFIEKDSIQIDLMRKAGVCAASISSIMEGKIKNVVKTDDRVTHEEVSESIERDLEVEIRKLPKDIDQSYLELCFRPIVQSGGNYGIERTETGECLSVYNEQLLYFDVISYYLWIGYKGYCSFVGRTLLVSPNKKGVMVLESAILLAEHLVKSIGADKTFEEVQEEGRAYARQIIKGESREELLGKLRIRIGAGIGIRPEEGPVFRKENEKPKNKTTFVLSVEFENVSDLFEDDPEKTATVHIDNVVLFENKVARLLTPFSISAQDYIMEKPLEQTKRTKLGRRLRNRDKELERANEISEHQTELMDRLIEEQLQYYKGQGKVESSKEEAQIQHFVSYQKETQIPRGSAVIKTDRRAMSVIISIFGISTPFHIGVIKSATKTVEDGMGYLKIAFLPPTPDAEGVNNLLSIIVKDTQENITAAWKEINSMKRSNSEEADEGIEEGEQEELQLINGQVETLQNVYIRFDHRTGVKKNAASIAELHKNGIRYHTKTGDPIDILFSSVKHMFYQPGAAETPTIIHFRLSSPLQIQEKKTMDVQIFRECTVNAVHDTRKTRGMSREDAEIYEEEEEERVQEEINEVFYEFAEKVSAQSRIILEQPLSRGFYGVPYRQNVLVQPTSECIISITEFPFFILAFKEIEILNFERRIGGVTTCDMVFVLKDKTKNPVYIHGVSSSDVSWLMDFFDSKDVCFTETKVNIQWGNVLRSVLEDPVAFYEGGAWAILQPNREIAEDEDEPEAAADSDVVNLDTTEEESSEDEEFSTNDESFSSDGSTEELSEEQDEEENEYADSNSDNFVVDDEDEDEPRRKKHKSSKY